jgi:hypothetical protein
MALTNADLRASFERAGDEYWQALIGHHEDAYPASPPTPGEVCRAEAERLNGTGLGGAPEFELVESRAVRAEPELEVTHCFRYRPLDVRLWTEAYRDYGPLQAATRG